MSRYYDVANGRNNGGVYGDPMTDARSGGSNSNSYRSNPTGGYHSSSDNNGSRPSSNNYGSSDQRSSSGNHHSDWNNAPTVYTDGSCSNNGRSGAKAGYGVNWGPGHRDNCYGEVEGRQTSNRGELKAVDRALEQALDRGYDRVTVRTDSKLTKDSLDTWKDGWKRNGWTKSNGEPVKNTDLLRSIDDKMDKLEVRYEHVKGHSGDRGNEDADRMARKGASYKY